VPLSRRLTEFSLQWQFRSGFRDGFHNSAEFELGTSEESTMTVSVFIGTSVDGFIARPNGDLDFLPEGGGEPHGYNEFIASVDAIVIGRNDLWSVAIW
jgi:hypothetical protein